jgi:tetratricopeptide (TPR) repeat protein/transcriptional regulator with XRE-family HTH domain
MVAYPQEKKTPFAQLLRRYRIRAGMTQRSLAEKIENHISRPGGLTEKGIQALENGIRKIPHRDTVEKLAEALGLTDDERAEFRREADKLRVKRKASDEHDLTETLPSPTGDASQYLPRPSPSDAIAPEVVEQAADESSFPPLPEHFVGRERELDWLTDRLRRGITTGITAVKGIGGVGKTSLAIRAVEILREEGHFVGGVGFVMCQDKTDHIQVIREVLHRFEPQRLIPSDATDPQLHDTTCQLLGNKRVLVILDNIEPGLDIERVVAPLQAAKATILLTSRGYLSVGECLDLQLLATDEARTLFCQYLGKAVDNLVEDEPAAVTRIVERLGNHTLAVKVVALYARGTRRSLRVLADELKTPFEVEKITESINRVFQHSFEALSSEAQKVFAALGAFATVEFSRNAAKALARALEHAHPGACVDSLIDYGLVEPSELRGLLKDSDTERLQLHPLLRAFAIDQLAKFPNEFDARTRHAIASYYADYASRPQRVSLWPDDKNITEALIYAYDNHLHELVARICLGMHLFWRDYGRANQTEMYVAWGIAAAEEYAASAYSEYAYRALATLRLAHARFLRLTGKLEEAEHLAREALSTFKGAGHLHGAGAAYVVLANIARDKGKYEQARASLREALGIYQSNEALDVGGQGLALCFLGQASQRLGEIEISDHELEQSIEISEKINDQWCLGLARLLHGNNLKQTGRFQEAEALYRGVLEFYQFVDSRRSIGVALSSLGEIALSLGNLTEAEGYLLESLRARRESRDLRGEAVDATFLGELTAIQERYAASSRYFKEALKNWQEVHDPRGQGWVLAEQARFALTHDNLDDADSLLARSLRLLRKVGDKRTIATSLCISAEVALRRGEIHLADDRLRQAEALANKVQDLPLQAHIKLVNGMVAAARGNKDRAEACYRASLAIANKVGIRREMAQAQDLLGRLLVERQDLFEGRQLLAQAEENYSHLGVPAAARMREIMVELGCAAGD